MEFFNDANESDNNPDDHNPEEKNPPTLTKGSVKNPPNVALKKNTLKMGKVRRFKYSMKNIGSLYITSWVREDSDKDSNLYISSSNFKREHSRRKLKKVEL